MASRRPRLLAGHAEPRLVERIEVARGPSAENSAQAVAGTINIILKDAPRPGRSKCALASPREAATPAPTWLHLVGPKRHPELFAAGLGLPQPGRRTHARRPRRLAQRRLATDPASALDRLRQRPGFNTALRFVWRFDERNSLNLQLFAHQHNWDSTGSNLAGRPACACRASASFNPKTRPAR